MMQVMQENSAVRVYAEFGLERILKCASSFLQNV